MKNPQTWAIALIVVIALYSILSMAYFQKYQMGKGLSNLDELNKG